MKLLICTQKVDKNDPILGFFHRWIEEFATHYEAVHVLCLEKGEYSLPENVTVHSLGKEAGLGKVEYLLNFYRAVWLLRKEYNVVFVHMNPVYIVLGGILWRLMKKKIALWYTHKSVDMKLRIAEKLAHNIFSASRESFRLPTKKLTVTGHAIDTEAFAHLTHIPQNELTLVTVGRISPAKRIDLFIRTIKELKTKGVTVRGVVVGGAGTHDQEKYEKEMHILVKELGIEDKIEWAGAVKHDEIQTYLARADIFLHLSETGSMDKAVLEAFASGVPVLSSSEAFEEVLRPKDLFLTQKTPDEIATFILENKASINEKRPQTDQYFRSVVARGHGLGTTISQICIRIAK